MACKEGARQNRQNQQNRQNRHNHQNHTLNAHRVVVGVSLFLHHSREPDDGDDGVQDEGQEEVFMEGDPLTAETPEEPDQGVSRGRGRLTSSTVMETLT